MIFSKNLLHTSLNTDIEGSSYEVPGLPPDRCFNLDYLLLLDGLAKTVDYGKDRGTLLFFGDNVRGAIAPMKNTD